MAERVFHYNLSGLVMDLVVTDTGDVTITCLEGHADINALYWGDGDATGGEGSLFALTKATNALNMNGSGEAWDASKLLSNAGLGSAGTEKGTYLDVAGGPYHTNIGAVDLDALNVFGIRATSTSTPEGSIKAASDYVPPHLELVKMLDFEQDNVDGGFMGLFTQTVPIDWNSAGNLPVEIQGGLSGYGGHTGYGAGEDQYLDTAQSAGNINLTSADGIGVDVTTGAKAHIDIAVAPQYLTYPGNGQHYETSPNSSFDLVFNDQVVKTFTLADFSAVTNQEFQTFSFDKDANGNDLVGVAGDDHISIVSHGEQQNYTGFSVDHVVLQEWIV